MASLGSVVCRIVLCCWLCLASRDPPTPTWPRAAGALQPGPSALAEHALSLEGDPAAISSKEPPHTEELKKHIAPDGPLAKRLKQAADEAKELEKAAKEWSDTSKEIPSLEKQVVSEASKDSTDLEKADAKVRSSAEAGAEKQLEQEVQAEEEEETEQKEEAAKDGKDSKQKAQADEKDSKADGKDSDKGEAPGSLLSLGGVEESRPPMSDTTEISSLISTMNSTYGQLEALMKKTETKAIEVTATALKWASQPHDEFEQKAQDAYKVVNTLTDALKTGNEKVSKEVALGTLPGAGSALEHGKQ